MHITLIALGSRGDILPIAALGRGLHRAGHEIRLISFQDFARIAEEYQIDFHPVEIDSHEVMTSMGGLDLAEAGRNPIKMLVGIMRSFGAITGHYEKAFSDTRIWNTGAIINQIPAGMYGIDLAEKLNVPHFTAAVIPLHPTGEFPLPLLTLRSSGSRFNRLTYWIGWQLGWQPMRSAINKFRRDGLNLDPAPTMGYDQLIRSKPTLNGFSSIVVPRPVDWQANVHITGYWFPPSISWSPTPALLEFLDSGNPPVFIGFGSMPLRDAETTTRIILGACRRSGMRVILGGGWGGLGGFRLPDYAFQVDYAPYEWLFPRMSAIVHHGGSGTTAYALKSGRPSFVIPFGADQFFWGARSSALSVGPSPLPFKHLGELPLAEKLAEATTNNEYAQNAALLRSRLESENGIAQAVDIINSYL